MLYFPFKNKTVFFLFLFIDLTAENGFPVDVVVGCIVLLLCVIGCVIVLIAFSEFDVNKNRVSGWIQGQNKRVDTSLLNLHEKRGEHGSTNDFITRISDLLDLDKSYLLLDLVWTKNTCDLTWP